MTKPIEFISPDPAFAYAALARRIAAIDAILLCSGVTKRRDDMIRNEVVGAMQVIAQYEHVVSFVPSVTTEAFSNEINQISPSPQGACRADQSAGVV